MFKTVMNWCAQKRNRGREVPYVQDAGQSELEELLKIYDLIAPIKA